MEVQHHIYQDDINSPYIIEDSNIFSVFHVCSCISLASYSFNLFSLQIACHYEITLQIIFCWKSITEHRRLLNRLPLRSSIKILMPIERC